ncbi:MAG: XRE family transcriptional regulator [Muribaculaceae bacterium]|nr:XRE family transcriptional regulator [Muribaculaceae bacterium]
MEPIGMLIRREFERKERSVTWFARKLSCDRSNIYRLFQKHSVDTALLRRISIILEHNFFEDLSASLTVSEGDENL